MAKKKKSKSKAKAATKAVLSGKGRAKVAAPKRKAGKGYITKSGR